MCEGLLTLSASERQQTACTPSKAPQLSDCSRLLGVRSASVSQRSSYGRPRPWNSAYQHYIA